MKLMAASPSRKEERISRHLSLLGDADVDAQTRRGRVQGRVRAVPSYRPQLPEGGGGPLYPAAQWRAQGFEWRSRCARGVLGDHALVTPPLVITSEQVAELVGLSTAR